VAPSGGEIAANPDGVLDMLAEACVETVRRDGADAVILGGLAFAGMAERIAGKVPVPLIDNVVAAIRMAEAAAALGLAKPRSGSFSPTSPIRTTGLSAELAALIEGQKQ
jgi:Asp/Glu/hydantoin racemase